MQSYLCAHGDGSGCFKDSLVCLSHRQFGLAMPLIGEAWGYHLEVGRKGALIPSSDQHAGGVSNAIPSGVQWKDILTETNNNS